MAGNILITIAYVYVIRNRYRSDQIITRINANCKVNQVPFPAVSICNFSPVSLKRTAGITEILRNNNRTQKEIENFYRNLPNLIHFRGYDENLDDVSEIMEILKQHYFNTETIMEEVHQQCEDLLLYCTFNSKKKNCNKMFNFIKTYEGHCCAFNYAALNDGNMDEISYDDDIEYYSDPSNEGTSGIYVTSKSGRGSGLSVVLNVEPSDYPEWSLTPYNGAKILLNDPTDYPEITVLYKYVVLGQSLDIKVEPRIFQSDDDIRHVPLEKRNCAFHDEFLLQHTDRFSSETCKTECKMKNYADQCGCVPYKYPKGLDLDLYALGQLSPLLLNYLSKNLNSL
nr:pickpocket protein 28-like [Vanessa tameamea]